MRASNQFADATAGVIYVHSSPAAVCPHIEWALADILDCRPDLSWTGQPAAPGLLRTCVDWVGPVGTAARLADVLRSWPMLRFEITENPSEGVDGERFSYAPDWVCGAGAPAPTATSSSERCVCAPCCPPPMSRANCTAPSERHGTKSSSRTAAATKARR